MDDRSDNVSWGKFSDAAEAELPEYQSLSGLAVVGLLLGLLSSLAIIHIGLSFIGGAAALCSVIALLRIAAAPSEISGRWLALAGLVLAVFMTAAGLAREMTERRLLDIHSRDIAMQWFDFLKNGEPEKALELTNSGTARRSLDENLWKKYLSTQTDYEALQQFVSKPEVLALINLGERAEIRHYTCIDARASDVAQVYAVTYVDDGIKKSFFVQLHLSRAKFPKMGSSSWRTASTYAPWSPDKPA